MQKQVSSIHEQCERHAKGTQKRKKVKPYLKLIASFHLNMDCGVSVLGGPKTSYAGFMSCFKVHPATSYYSVHPVILSDTHMKLYRSQTWVIKLSSPKFSCRVGSWCMAFFCVKNDQNRGIPNGQKCKDDQKLVGGWTTQLKNISQNWNLPQVGVKIKNIWKHHLEKYTTWFQDRWRSLATPIPLGLSWPLTKIATFWELRIYFCQKTHIKNLQTRTIYIINVKNFA